jgi:hypothetical protein
MSRARFRLGALAAAAVLALAGSTTAGAATSHTARFTSFHQRVGCGIQLKVLGGMSCFSEALPSTQLDGYVELHAHGAARIGERGDSPWRNGKSSKLKKRDRWSRTGVKCVRKAALRCTNADGHGFTLTPVAYALF